MPPSTQVIQGQAHRGCSAECPERYDIRRTNTNPSIVTLPSEVSVQITEKVSLSVMGLRLHSSSHSSLGSMGTTCEQRTAVSTFLQLPGAVRAWEQQEGRAGASQLGFQCELKMGRCVNQRLRRDCISHPHRGLRVKGIRGGTTRKSSQQEARKTEAGGPPMEPALGNLASASKFLKGQGDGDVT